MLKKKVCKWKGFISKDTNVLHFSAQPFFWTTVSCHVPDATTLALPQLASPTALPNIPSVIDS
jgi:hypothetical protein